MTHIKFQFENFQISTEKNLLQLDRIHRFLSQDAYWCRGIPHGVLKRAIESSLNFGLYDESNGNQIGFARIVTDSATFAWLCDVYIESEYRGKGLAKWLMECVLQHPDVQKLRRICLATKDAHELYKKFGFKVTETPNNWMEIKDSEIYLNLDQTK